LKALEALRESNGSGETVTDREIIEAINFLAKKEGIFAEPAGAAALAGLKKMKDKFEKEARIVLIVSGSGLKTPMI
jgi:threonine synthase